jgi:predicted enzyme related to lactoylglutathione lyase
MRALTVFGACVLVAIGGSGASAQAGTSVGAASSQASAASPAKECVTGIGGLFIKAADPKALAAWYERHLGIDPTPTSYEAEPWKQEAGPTVFAPVAASTKYFGDASKQWMINFRVRDLDVMVAQLKGAGIVVEVDPKAYPNGRFARLQDPEGNGIQLWQPQVPPR